MKDRIDLVLKSKKPIKLLLAYLLRKLKVSNFFIIDKCLYKLRFYPSVMLMHFWVDKNAREDEAIFLNRLVKIGSTVIDIGANVGTLTLPLSLQVEKSGRVFSIEANPTTFKYLKGNIELNKFKNIVAINKAVGDSIGKLNFSNVSSDDLNRVVVDGSKDSIEVPVDTIDNIVHREKIGRIRLMKIDIEGYELFALKGGTETLKKVDILFFESWENHFNNFNYSTKDVLQFLHAYDFKIFKIINDKLELITDENYISKDCENLIAFKNVKEVDRIYETN